MDIKARNKEVKGILAKEFGRQNVSVRDGGGTAKGWCEIEINIPDPCPFRQHENPCSRYCVDGICKGNNKAIYGGWGDTVRQKLDKALRNKAESLLKDIEFDTFPNDMGGNDFLKRSISVNFV